MSKADTVMRGTGANGKHYVLEVLNDDSVESPREDQENFGTMVYAHRRYILGDERITEPSMMEYLENRRLDPEKIVSLPLYLYDHSGLSFSTKPFSCPWDSGCVGAIYVTHAKIKEEFGEVNEETIQKAKDLLETEVKIMDAYLSGEAYGIRLYETVGGAGEEGEDDRIEGGEEFDCWGLLGRDAVKDAILDYLDKDALEALRPALEDEFGALPTPEPVTPPSPAAKAPRIR